MTTINKKYLQQKLLEQNEKLTPEQAFYLVRDFFSVISEALAQGNEVKINAFGCFRLRNKRPRPGRDILKQKSVLIGARRVVTFKPATRLVKEMKQNHDHLQSLFVDENPQKHSRQSPLSSK